jgi:16S rRNA (cytosine967-C5)-methyltransferase
MDHHELLASGFSRTSMSPIGWEKPHEEKRMRLEELTVFQDGFLEVQDEASQMACLLLAPGLAGKMLDYCAGGGGKSLLIASANPNLKVFVHDHEPKRMRDIPVRFGRAGLAVPTKWDQFDRDFDLVLADVPCTGSGTWRRQPERRWQCDQNELTGLLATQAKILRKTSALVRPGGFLAYMTCSLFQVENMDQVSAFLEGSEEFDAVPLADWPGMSEQFPLPYLRGQSWLQWSPHVDGTDGFFMALFKRRST